MFLIEKITRIGVAVILKKDGKVLMGKRKGAHGSGTWSFPGGHLEFNETIEETAKRELKEETNLEIKTLTLGPYTEDFFEKEDKHYITIFVLADYVSGSPELMEPDRCEEWLWFSWNEMPENVFLPIKNLKKQGFKP